MYRTMYPRPVFGFGRPWTPAVRALILACGGVWLAQLLLGPGFTEWLGLDTARPWQLWRWASYLFLHGGLFHLLFNMFALWMFGSDVEERLGTERFVAYYLLTGIGAAFSVVLVDLLFGRQSFVVGASGAVFGILLAYGVLYAERTITLLVFFVLPVSMKARHFVAVFAVLELLFGVAGGDRVAHFAHLGGMLFGLLLLRTPATSVLGGGAEHLRRLRDHLATLNRARDDRRLDELLGKVNEKGIGSLNDDEKRFLHRMSRRKRWH